jgi:hypothetical protein
MDERLRAAVSTVVADDIRLLTLDEAVEFYYNDLYYYAEEYGLTREDQETMSSDFYRNHAKAVISEKLAPSYC